VAQGPIGLMTVLCLQAFGATTILVSDPSQGRRELAERLGANRVLDPTKEDIQVISKEMCDGRGPHVVFECAGVQKSLTTAIQTVRKAGTIMGLALWETKAEIDPNYIVLKQITYMGAIPYVPGDFQEVISAIKAGMKVLVPRLDLS
jgi:threonine dehydrogenase-like Zn-dependent dehydrogenase